MTGHRPAATRFLAASALDSSLFIAEGALGLDPAVRRAASAHMPYAWTTADYDELGEGQRWLASRLQRRGVYGGVATPVQDYAGGPAYITMYSAFKDEAQQIISRRGAELAYGVTSFHQDAKIMLPLFRRTNDRASLTTREIDCLRLAAAPRTVNDTSTLLKVTARTMEFHLKNAGDKLGASNKLMTVAIAISICII